MSDLTRPARIRRVNRGRNHWYVDNDGVRVPGVTSVLSDGLAKPALINWAANTTAEYAVDHWSDLSEQSPSARLNTLKKARYADRDAAARRGTEVHKLAEKLTNGEEVEVPEELAGHVEAYVKFLDDFDPQSILTEATVYHETHLWCGTLDMIADFPTLGRRLICDIKTARSGVFPDNAIQLAAYRNATHYIVRDDELPMIPVDGAAVIHVRADGCDLVPVDAGPGVYRVFRYCQQLADWANNTSKGVVGDAITPPRLEATA